MAALCGSAHAIDGYWRGDVSNNWNDGIDEDISNWYSQPGGTGSLRNVPDLNARFADGAVTRNLVIRGATRIGRIIFEAGAPAYSFRLASEADLTIGLGIANQSSQTSTIRVDGPESRVILEGEAQLTAVSARAVGIATSDEAGLVFRDSSRGGNAFVVNTTGGFTSFQGESSAEQMRVTNRGGTVYFYHTSTGDRADIINEAGGRLSCNKTGTAELSLGSLSNDGAADIGRCSVKIARNFMQTADGELQLRIRSANHFGTLETGQNAVLGGGLLVNISPTTAIPRTFTLVKAGGRRIGSFASLSIVGRGVKGRLAYGAKEVRLIVERQ